MRQIFKYPDEVTSVKQLKPISLSDLVKELCNYLRDNDLWSKKVNEKDFETYLVTKLKVTQPYMLSYKITNVGLMVGSLKSAQRLYGDALKDARALLSADFTTVFVNEKTFFFNQLNIRLAAYKNHEAQLTAMCLDPASRASNQALIDCLQAQTVSRLGYLSATSTDIISEFLFLFENLMNKADFDYIKEFLNELKSHQFLRDCFQLCICLGKHDLDLCLLEMNANKKADSKNSAKYTRVLKNLFNFIMDTKHPTANWSNAQSKEFLKSLSFLNQTLNERNLKLVPVSYKTFGENDASNDGDSDVIIIDENDYEDGKPSSKQAVTSTPLRIDWEKLATGLESFIRSKLEANSVLNFEQLVKLEKHMISLANIKSDDKSE